MKKNVLLNLIALFTGSVVLAQTARVQVVHNSPDPNAGTVDIYIDAGAQPAINDLDYRSATPYVDLTAGTEIQVGIAPGTSTGPSDIIVSFPFTLTEGETYIIVADGLIGGAGAETFGLEVLAGAREVASNPAQNTDVTVYHGSIDAPAVDVYESSLGATVANDFTYRSFSGSYATLPFGNYYFEVRNSNQTATIAAVTAPLTGDLAGAGRRFSRCWRSSSSFRVFKSNS
jgi:hypothetical protein